MTLYIWTFLQQQQHYTGYLFLTMPRSVGFVRNGLQHFFRVLFQTLIVELLLKPVLIVILLGLGLVIIGLSVSWFLLLPSSGSKEVVKDFNEFLQLHRLEDSKVIFSKHGNY